MLSAVPTSIPLPVYLRHMLPELGLLLEIDWRIRRRMGTLVTGEATLMCPLYMLPLLITVRESLKAPMRLQIGALQELPFLIPCMY